MPKVQQTVLGAVFYLYANKRDAKLKRNAGGTGFLIQMDSERNPGVGFHNYGVTNWHNITKGYPTIRLNTKDGGVDIVELGTDDWQPHPDGHDVAVTLLKLDPTLHEVTVIPANLFATEKALAHFEVGVGDDVFMVGRFMDVDDGDVNRPFARFGNIASMPVPIKSRNHAKPKECYCIDMHSRTGFSGSPVFVYRLPGGNFEKRNHLGGAFQLLLGVHRGQFPDEMKIKERKKRQEESAQETEKYIEGTSGMTITVPCERMIETLHCDPVKKQRDAQDKEDEENIRAMTSGVAIEESAPEVNPKAGDKILETMLKTPPAPRKPAKKAKASKKAGSR